MLNPDDYTIGWICALKEELVAATEFLDERHGDPDHLPAHDDNAYVLGRIGKHNVAIAALPAGQYGLVSAANVARDLLRSFHNVRIGLMVGIGGGAPSQKHDVRLGDVVVGTPGNSRGGVLQYDYGKVIQGKDFKLTGHLNQPQQGLLTALTVLGAQYEVDGHDIQAQIDRLIEKKPRLRAKYQKPDSNLDRLYLSSFEHVGNDIDNCATTCDNNSKLVARLERSPEQDSPTIHYGLIASSNKLMKDAYIRDELSAREDVLCFEMEAAGLMNNFPCVVIRGICDYSDTHKNKIWQGYAAMTAAAFAKDLLQKVAPNKVAAQRRLNDFFSNVDAQLAILSGSVSKSQMSIEVLQLDKQYEKVKQWLSAAEVSSNLNRAIETRHEGSGQKVIKSGAYINWKQDPKSFLWLNGIPGCGKTIIASTIIEDLQADPKCSKGLLYYFFDFKDAQKQDFNFAIRSLLAQFYHISNGAKATLESLYSSCRNGEEQPRISLLKSTFTTMAEEAGETWIVIDALDECLLRRDLLEWLRDFPSEPFNAHLLVTSRPEQDIKSVFDRVYRDQDQVTIQNELLEDDIRSYVQARVRDHESLSRWHRRPDVQKEIETELVKKANGMFRWVACQLDALEKCYDRSALRSTLASLPTTLDETYARILSRIPPEHIGQTIRLLQFLTYSERPLRVDEAVDATLVSIGPDVPRGTRFDPKNRMPVPAEITRYCSSLVVLVPRKLKDASSRSRYILEEIQLAHFSVKDYLISDRLQKEAAQHLKETSARSLMAEVCLAYLLELDPEMPETQQKKEFPFSEYCADYWATYAVVGEQNSVAVRQLAVELLQSHSSIVVCRELQTSPWDSPSGGASTGLYYASLLGLPRCVGILLETGADMNAYDSSYVEALQVASERGHGEIVQLLIDKGTNIKFEGGKYGNKLRDAVAGRHRQVVSLIGRLQTFVNAQHESVCQMPYLDLDDVDENRSELWNSSISAGDIGLVGLLLDLGVDLTTDKCGQTPFNLAAAKGHLEIVKMLLKRGADWITANDEGWTPLISAADQGHIEVVQLLLDRGADVSIVDNNGRTPLSAAACKGYVEIVDLLIAKGANRSVKDKNGFTPLRLAAEAGHTKVVQLLYDEGVDIMAQVPVERWSTPPLSAPLLVIDDLGDAQWAQSLSRTPHLAVDHVVPLRMRIHQSLIPTYQDSSKGFLPKGAIDTLVTEDSVERELARRKSRKSTKSTSVQDIARHVCQEQAPGLRVGKRKSRRPRSFRNIFAILVVAKKPSAIRHFIEEGVSDADLPLVKVPRPNLQNVFDLRRSDEKDRPLDCFRGWDSIEILDFEEWQWMTLSPFFAKGARKDAKHYPLPDRIILPFTADSRQQNMDVKIGGYSQVFKVDIHPNHHDFHDNKAATSSFAIKHLVSRDKSDFKKEVEMLKNFSDDSHPHLVSLLATYEQFNCYYLIFHWADADLFNFWQKTRPNPIFNHDTVRWVAQQCQGIASGLAQIHCHVTVSDMENNRLFGRHGDIKPENILWFSDPTDSSDKGTLKITDFGLAEFNSRQSRSNKPGHEVANSPTYRPPECVLRGRVIRRSYDIWSLACVYLMFITWLLGGRTLLMQFALCRLGKYKPNHPEIQDDAFFEIIKDDDDEIEGVVKSAVIEFIEGLHKHPKCSDFIHEFLDMIMGDMLVVEYVKQGNRRITSAEVHSKLNLMHTKCVQSKEYAVGVGKAREAIEGPWRLPKTEPGGSI